MKNNNCCDKMRIAVESNLIIFDRVQKFFIINSGSEDVWQDVLSQCPFCGKNLPDLRFVYWEEMKKSYPDFCKTFNEHTTMYDENIPSEFQTDEWWKKRGL